GPKGRIALYFGNKTGNVISQVRVQINQIQGIQIYLLLISLEIKMEYSQIAPMIAPRTMIQQLITVTCLAPFTQPITFALYFEYVYHFDHRLSYKIDMKRDHTSIPSSYQLFLTNLLNLLQFQTHSNSSKHGMQSKKIHQDVFKQYLKLEVQLI